MNKKSTINIELDEGTMIKVESGTSSIGEQEVTAKERVFNFENIKNSIVGISKHIQDALEKAQPDKATVKFGIEVSAETGKLITLITKGSAQANLEITLEWQKKKN